MKLLYSANGEFPVDIPKGTIVKLVWTDVMGGRNKRRELPSTVKEFLPVSTDYGEIYIVDEGGVCILHVNLVPGPLAEDVVEYTTYPWGVIDYIYELR